MNGNEYRARVELTNAAGEIVAAEGETCERVAASSLPWLAEQGLIVLVAPAPKKSRQAAEKES